MESLKEFLKGMVKKIRCSLEVETIDATDLTTEERLEEFRTAMSEREVVRRLRQRQGLVDPPGPIARYDLEYSNAGAFCREARFKGTHYWFWTPLLDHLDLIGPVWKVSHQPWVLEVGAGNGELLLALRRWYIGQRISAVETSEVAVKRIRKLGFAAYQGRLENLSLSRDFYDLLFLSYFVDRDQDQRGTFITSVGLLKKGGTLVLEGLFPCVLADSNGISYGQANVTKGDDAVEDISLVVNEFESLGASLHRVVVGQRLVCSLDGAEVLPSYTLVFKKDLGVMKEWRPH
ncbi:MAG TPA: class I SAM-dependent methyltransferase [Candidatus Limnocylindria bacterium]|nr:class I SAM-dependent methyltransferase [Candidatus Limnocylindria bacterium]